MVRILVIKPSSLGDIVHTAPAVDLLSRLEPRPRISWIVHESYVDLVREFPGVDEVIPFPRSWFRGTAALRRFPSILRWVRGLRRGFDVSVDFQGLMRSGLMGRLSGARDRFGFRQSRELAWLHYHHRLRLPPEVAHAVDRNLRLADAARGLLVGRGAAAPAPDAPGDIPDAGWLARWRLPLPTAVADVGARELGGDGPPAVALCPSGRWDSKRWPPERWAALAELLWNGSPRLRPILLCGGAERAEADEILARVSGRVPLDAWVGRTGFWDTASILARCAAVVGVDSFPLHLAWALGAPTVALFGPSIPARVGPRGDLHSVIWRDDLPCIGCWKHECPLPEWLCMPGIPAEEVAGAARRAASAGSE